MPERGDSLTFTYSEESAKDDCLAPYYHAWVNFAGVIRKHRKHLEKASTSNQDP